MVGGIKNAVSITSRELNSANVQNTMVHLLYKNLLLEPFPFRKQLAENLVLVS